MPQQDPEVIELAGIGEVKDDEQLPDLVNIEVKSELSSQAVLPNCIVECV